MTDREQTRRDVEAWMKADGAVKIASGYCLTLLAELKQAERQRNIAYEQKAMLHEKLEQAEREATEANQRYLTELDRAEQAEREREGQRLLFIAAKNALAEAEARLAKVPALVKRHRKFAERVLNCDTYGCENGPNRVPARRCEA